MMCPETPEISQLGVTTVTVAARVMLRLLIFLGKSIKFCIHMIKVIDFNIPHLGCDFSTRVCSLPIDSGSKPYFGWVHKRHWRVYSLRLLQQRHQWLFLCYKKNCCKKYWLLATCLTHDAVSLSSTPCITLMLRITIHYPSFKSR